MAPVDPRLFTLASRTRTVLEDTRWRVKSKSRTTQAGRCAVAAALLCRVLEAHGYAPLFVQGNYAKSSAHCWVELHRERLLVDITASQFGRGKVLIQKILRSRAYTPELVGPRALEYVHLNWMDPSPEYNQREIEGALAKLVG